MEIKNEIKCFLCNATFKKYNFLQKHINNFHSDPISVTNQETFDGEKEIFEIDNGRTAFTESKITEFYMEISEKPEKESRTLELKKREIVNKKTENPFFVNPPIIPMERNDTKISNATPTIKVIMGPRFYRKAQPKCYICNKEFMELSEIEKHIYSDHAPCQYCDHVSIDSVGHQKHLKKFHPDFKCNVCDKTYYRSGVLKNHIISLHGGNVMLNCQICDIQVRGTNDLLRHGKIFHLDHNVKASNNIGEEIKVVKIPIKDMPIKKKGQKIANIVKKYLKNIE